MEAPVASDALQEWIVPTGFESLSRLDVIADRDVVFETDVEGQRRYDLALVLAYGTLQYDEYVDVGGLRRFPARRAPLEDDLVDVVPEFVLQTSGERFERPLSPPGRRDAHHPRMRPKRT